MRCPECGSPAQATYKESQSNVAECYNKHMWNIPVKISAAQRLLAETAYEYVKRLGKLGIQSLGKGMYGQVFQHPTMPNVVVKLLLETDPMYQKYVTFCQKHQSNPYVPKIIGVESAQKAFDTKDRWNLEQANLYLVFMEKLTPASNKQYKAFGDYAANLANTQWRKQYSKKRTDIADKINDSTLFWGGEETANELSRPNIWRYLETQKVDKNLAVLAKFFFPDGLYLDIHQNNVMMRGQQIVIIDPFMS